MSILQQIIMVSAAVLATMLTRFIPFLVFRPGKATPKYIIYLGKVLPASVFALLVVYCLRHLAFDSLRSCASWHEVMQQDAIAQLIAVAATMVVHVWRKNLMWSIAAGTICYMLLIRL